MLSASLLIGASVFLVSINAKLGIPRRPQERADRWRAAKAIDEQQLMHGVPFPDGVYVTQHMDHRTAISKRGCSHAYCEAAHSGALRVKFTSAAVCSSVMLS